MARMNKAFREVVAANFVDDPREFLFLLEDIVRHQANSDPEFERTWKDINRALYQVAEATTPLYKVR